jgi:hypothetical protein
MSEARDAERRRILGGFAATFLMAAGYSQSDVLKFGDLSDVTTERVRELLTAKVEERRRVIEWAKTQRFGPLSKARKKGRWVGQAGRRSR